MNFLLNNSPLVHSRPSANSWNNSRFTLTKGCSLKSDGDGGTDEQLRMLGIKVPQAINMQNAANGFLASKNPTSMLLNTGPFLLAQRMPYTINTTV